MSDVEKSSEDSKQNVFEWFICALICLNIVAIILNSFDGINAKCSKFFTGFEIISIVIFTIEYIWRICVAPKKLEFIISPLAIIDLIVIMSSFFSLVLGIYGIDLRILRIFRLFRVFKLFRYNNSYQMLANVLKNEKDKLIAAIFIMAILILFASSMMYSIENEYDNEFALGARATDSKSHGYYFNGDNLFCGLSSSLCDGENGHDYAYSLAIQKQALKKGYVIDKEKYTYTDDDAEWVFVKIDLKYFTNQNFTGELSKKIVDIVEHVYEENKDDRLKVIKSVLEKVQEKVGKEYATGGTEQGVNGLGYYFNNDYLFFGWCEIAYKGRIFSLAIDKKAMKKGLNIQEDCLYKDTLPLEDKNWIYIPVDEAILTEENPVDKLCDRIVDIVRKVYEENIK
jgi:hypothetical protein